MRNWLVFAAMAAVVSLSDATAGGESLKDRGAYLVNGILACANCHTPRDANGPIVSQPLAGGRVFETPAFKAFASNITPDRDTGIGRWSDSELRTFMTTGERPSGVPVAPIMPTAFYKALTPHDLDALIVYLRSVAPIRNEVPPADYRKPFGHEEAPYADKRLTDADMVDPVKRGMYLVTLGHCLECHTPDVAGKRDYQRSAGRGGRTFPGPWGESRSSNITSHTTAGLGAWTDAEIKRAITQGVSRDGRKLKPPMAFAAYAAISAEDLDAIVAFLRSLPARE